MGEKVVLDTNVWRLLINGDELPSLPCVASPSTSGPVTVPMIDVATVLLKLKSQVQVSK